MTLSALSIQVRLVSMCSSADHLHPAKADLPTSLMHTPLTSLDLSDMRIVTYLLMYLHT